MKNRMLFYLVFLIFLPGTRIFPAHKKKFLVLSEIWTKTCKQIHIKMQMLYKMMNVKFLVSTEL